MLWEPHDSLRHGIAVGSFIIEGMQKGAVVTMVVAGLAMVGVVYAFVANASPYVTIAQAKTAKGGDFHVVGDLDKRSLHTDVARRVMTFDMSDDHGDKMHVLYTGEPPANMGDAVRIVAVGQAENGVFNAHKLEFKCPSKYEGVPRDKKPKPGVAMNR